MSERQHTELRYESAPNSTAVVLTYKTERKLCPPGVFEHGVHGRCVRSVSVNGTESSSFRSSNVGSFSPRCARARVGELAPEWGRAVPLIRDSLCAGVKC
ncbi:hypothetical protein MRX96_008293 [Rhipicephalus microplus]